MTKRPNIIIFNPDEMRADTMSHLGNPAAHTPFLDSFAMEDAVSFRNAFCQNPVCVPSRCSFTTGLYPHVNGHRTMAHLLHGQETTIFEELKNAGYYVWMNARNDLIAGQEKGLVERHATEIYYGGKSPQAPGPEENHDPWKELNFHAFYGGKLGLDKNGRNYSADDEDLDAAIERIRNHPKDQPLCLFLGTLIPHPAYQIEEPYYSLIDRSRIPARVHSDDCTDKAKIEDAIRKEQGIQDYPEEAWIQLRAVYLGMCAKADDQFKKLCDALKDAGEYDNSAIFFFSDHGDFAGDYDIAEKAQNTFEDCLTNVPFLVKPPKGYDIDPGISDSLVELVDFYATAMEMAGVTPAHTHYGRSLIKVLADRGTEIRDFVTCEGGRNPEEIHCDEFHAGGPNGSSPLSPYYPRHHAQTDADAHAKGFMIRNHEFKYVSRVNDEDELYDLKADPKEMHNVISDQKYENVKLSMERQLLKHLMKTADVVPYKYDNRFSNEMIWAKVQRFVPAEYEEEIRQKIENGANMFGLIMECTRRFGKVEK